ncbi:MAG: hypothetical protein CL868_10000 [Cytophagaceae bacterium]|nr:hypothetical protein [Cytophagaceae bacterium]|tara:strand:+ start:628 stop:1401 length:774 start_codon:yes stop_codon:yes gene_type:complete
MNTSKKEGAVLQNGARPTSKHDANLQKNNTFYFQAGLIVALLLAILAVEYRSTYTIPKIDEQDIADTFVIESPPVIRVLPKDVPPPSVPPVDYTLPPVVGNPVDSIIDFIPQDVPKVDPGENTGEPTFIPEPPEDPIETTDLNGVDLVPIYPGCEKKKTNEERKDCLESNLNKLISRKFNTGISTQYGLDGVNRIYTIFTVDHTGKIKDIKIRAAHPALEKEAQRVLDLIPEMQPGIKDGRRVNMIYSQPILYQVQD